MVAPFFKEASAWIVKITRGECPRGVPIPRVVGKDFLTSRLARSFKLFPYGHNIDNIVPAAMENTHESKKRGAMYLVNPRKAVWALLGSSTVPAKAMVPSITEILALAMKVCPFGAVNGSTCGAHPYGDVFGRCGG